MRNLYVNIIQIKNQALFTANYYYLGNWFCKDDRCLCLTLCDPPTILWLLVELLACVGVLYVNWLGHESDLKHKWLHNK